MILAIWQSFRRLPLWVQIWVVLILGPVNLATVFFLSEPGGWVVAALAIGGILPNLLLVFTERGMSKAMSIPHVIFWTPLILVLVFARPEGSAAYGTFLTVLLVVDAISLIFDGIDSWKWWQGDRGVT